MHLWYHAFCVRKSLWQTPVSILPTSAASEATLIASPQPFIICESKFAIDLSHKFAIECRWSISFLARTPSFYNLVPDPKNVALNSYNIFFDWDQCLSNPGISSFLYSKDLIEETAHKKTLKQYLLIKLSSEIKFRCHDIGWLSKALLTRSLWRWLSFPAKCLQAIYSHFHFLSFTK